MLPDQPAGSVPNPDPNAGPDIFDTPVTTPTQQQQVPQQQVVYQQPVAQQMVAAQQQPAPQAPVQQQPAVQQPAVQQPEVQQPAPQAPVQQQPAVQQAPQAPVQQQPAVQQAPQAPVQQQLVQTPDPQQVTPQQPAPTAESNEAFLEGMGVEDVARLLGNVGDAFEQMQTQQQPQAPAVQPITTDAANYVNAKAAQHGMAPVYNDIQALGNISAPQQTPAMNPAVQAAQQVAPSPQLDQILQYVQLQAKTQEETNNRLKDVIESRNFERARVAKEKFYKVAAQRGLSVREGCTDFAWNAAMTARQALPNGSNYGQILDAVLSSSPGLFELAAPPPLPPAGVVVPAIPQQPQAAQAPTHQITPRRTAGQTDPTQPLQPTTQPQAQPEPPKTLEDAAEYMKTRAAQLGSSLFRT